MATDVTCHLSEQQLTMLRGMLAQQRQFRLDQLDELARVNVRMRRPKSDGEAEVRRELTTGARAALADVCSAISRMDAGTYGNCLHCGQQLPLERLEILPHAALCMQCQRVQDALR
jgi:DnaK suppressor protein